MRVAAAIARKAGEGENPSDSAGNLEQADFPN
jgi:hypothetical protein